MTFVSVFALFLVLSLFACTWRCYIAYDRKSSGPLSTSTCLSVFVLEWRGRRARCGPWCRPVRPRPGVSTWGGWGDPFPPFSAVPTGGGGCFPLWGGPRSAGRPPPQRLFLFVLFLAAAAAVLTLSAVHDKDVLTDDS